LPPTVEVEIVFTVYYREITTKRTKRSLKAIPQIVFVDAGYATKIDD